MVMHTFPTCGINKVNLILIYLILKKPKNQHLHAENRKCKPLVWLKEDA